MWHRVRLSPEASSPFLPYINHLSTNKIVLRNSPPKTIDFSDHQHSERRDVSNPYEMSYSRRSRYYSPSPSRKQFRSPSPSPRRYRSISRSVSRSRSPSVENPGNNLYGTGLSPRITRRELEKHFASEGKVIDVHLVVDPWTRESRGFGFITMENVDVADRCIKYLDRSVLEGRVITVEKARRRRGRTPTPGRYLGLQTARGRRRTPSYSPRRRSPTYSPYRRSYSRSPGYSSDRSYSPEYSRRRSYSPDYRRRRSYSRSCSPYSRSPMRYRERSYSPDVSYYGRGRRYRSVSRSVSPGYYRSSRRSYSHSVSPRPMRVSRRSYSPSVSPESRRRRSRRSYSRSISPGYKGSKSQKGLAVRKYCRSCSRSRSPSVSASSRFMSRSASPKSTSSSS